MARKYTRDNRGRFASGGGGATARGGRLRTAGGNKRKTQTMKAAGAGGAGVMKGKVQRIPSQLPKASQSGASGTAPAKRDRSQQLARAKNRAENKYAAASRQIMQAGGTRTPAGKAASKRAQAAVKAIQAYRAAPRAPISQAPKLAKQGAAKVRTTPERQAMAQNLLRVRGSVKRLRAESAKAADQRMNAKTRGAKRTADVNWAKIARVRDQADETLGKMRAAAKRLPRAKRK